MGGSDTTSSALANIFYFLIGHPATYERLQAEIDGLGDKLTDCTAQAQLPYLNAVMYVIGALANPNFIIILFVCYNIATKVSDYSPLYYLAYSVLQRREVAEEWSDQCKSYKYKQAAWLLRLRLFPVISLKATPPLCIRIRYSVILATFPHSAIRSYPNGGFRKTDDRHWNPRSSILKLNSSTAVLLSYPFRLVQLTVQERTLRGWRCGWWLH